MILPFRATACSFFNPSETRTVITRLQSAFGARNVPGSVLASRRIRDGLLPYNEHDSCTHYPIILSKRCRCSSSGGDDGPHSPESFTSRSGECTSTTHRHHASVAG